MKRPLFAPALFLAIMTLLLLLATLPASPSMAESDILAPFSVAPPGHAAGTGQNRPLQSLHGSDLVYITVLGGINTENGWDIAVDSAGNSYVTGMTDSTDFPTTPGAYDTTLNDSFDAFVVKLSPDGSELVYATFIGGSALDQGSKITVDEDGNAYIAGYTYSTDFPTTPGAYDTDYNGGDIDAFVAKVSPDGSDLVYATYLGGDSDDYGGGITVDGAGNAFVTGYTESGNFPTTPGAYDTDYNSGGDVMAVKINAAGDDLVYSTFVGAGAFEAAYGIVLDGTNSAYLTGHTYSAGFPTTPGAFDTDYNGGLTDAFVIKLLPDGSDLAYASFLGGADFDDGKGIAVTTAGEATIAGRTNSTDFPTTPGSYDIDYNGGRDVFTIQMNPAGSALVYGTFLGGGGEDEAGGVDLDGSGQAMVTGWTFSSDFPTTSGVYDTSHNGDYDGFLVKLLPAGDDLDYGTFLGMDSTNYGRGIAVDAAGSAYIAGYAGAFPPDAFALKLAPGGLVYRLYLPAVWAD
ncbi:MAG: SBBP repeat-containing protein [Chloroflexi bacterium]|nr:SBBP repeat-containing protein [Chloroflexota bacterium]MCI0644526.1 SBBP repeat-containing protein [Chloroflexota bacterium]MCI0728785.1 SBBP repeat-containing protein [Chloroflexota bacterium]